MDLLVYLANKFKHNSFEVKEINEFEQSCSIR